MKFLKKDKHLLKAVSSTADFLKHSGETLRLPSKLIYCPTNILTKVVDNNYKTKKYTLNWGGDVYVFEDRDVAFATNFGMGNPNMAMALEILIALGAREVLLTGIAGSISEKADIGDIVVCTGAVRDEEVSSSYIPDGPLALPDAKLTARLEVAFADVKILKGYTWTTDVLYRETAEEILHYQKHDVLTVEMEAAAAFAVCEHYKIPCAAVFAVSDRLHNLKWEPAFGDKKIDEAMRKNLAACLDVFK